MNISFSGVDIQSKRIKKSIFKSIENVYEHGKFILGPEVQILEKTALGFHRVSIKRDRSYRTALKELPDYVEQGYLDAWIVPYVVEK